MSERTELARDRARPPHMLYLAWGYPPCRGGGVYRALATANLFAEHGWRVTVITVERETFERFTGVDSSLEAKIDPRVEIVRIPFAWPAQETDIRRYSPLKVFAPPLWRKVRSTLDKLPFPEVTYGPWRKPLEAAARRVHAATPVDLTVATANPNVTFAAAYDLHQRFGIPYVMDYRDAWLLNVFSGQQLFPDNSRQARWEKRLVENASEIWFVNEPIRQWHAQRYPSVSDQMHVVSNGWDSDLLADVPPDASTRPLRFGYLGTASGKVPLAQLVDAWLIAKRESLIPEDAELEIGGYLGYYAVPDARMVSTLARGKEAGIRYIGPVPKVDVGAFYSKLDVLLLALGKGRYVTSGKVFEYMATGKPIVSVHDPKNAASTVLRGYPGWVLPRRLDARPLAAALGEGARLARGSTDEDVAARRSFSLKFRRDKQFAPRIEAVTRNAGA